MRTSLESLLNSKKFRSLNSLVKTIERVKSETNFSSELQVRYNASVESFAKANNDQNFEWIFTLEKRFWRNISSKERRFLYLLSILLELPKFLIDLIERMILQVPAGDGILRQVIEFQYTSEALEAQLSELSQKELQVLNSIAGDLENSLSERNISIEQLLEVKILQISKRRPKSKHRHKGYRDHGSLGKDSIGLDPKRKELYIQDPGEQLFYEEEGYTLEELYHDFESPLLYQNIWHLFRTEEI
jgi:hypothetical protein